MHGHGLERNLLLSHALKQEVLRGQNLPSLLRGTMTVPSPCAPPTPSPVPHSRLPNLTLPYPTPPPPLATEGGLGRDGSLSPGSEMSLMKAL